MISEIYFATFRLQQYFNRMYDNPDYLFCRKRLEKMFPQLMNYLKIDLNIYFIILYFIFHISYFKMSKTIKGRLNNLNKYIQEKWDERHPVKPWNWFGISQNKFKKEKELFYLKWCRIYIATFKLQQYFNRMYDNPDYLFCRKRLDKMFS